MWLLPALLLVTAIVLSIPLSPYFAWIMDGKYRRAARSRWFEKRLDSGPQNWKQYTVALLIFNMVLFVFGFVVLCAAAVDAAEPARQAACWRRRTIFNSVISFMTNTDLQHYSGDQHLSNFSQIFFGPAELFLSASVGLLRPDGDHPRLPQRRARRQLLPRYVAGGGLHVPARRLRSSASSSCSRAADDLQERPGRHDARARLDGTDGQGRSQAADHRRRARRGLRVRSRCWAPTAAASSA